MRKTIFARWKLLFEMTNDYLLAFEDVSQIGQPDGPGIDSRNHRIVTLIPGEFSLAAGLKKSCTHSTST
jgi:hypothetical protein